MMVDNELFPAFANLPEGVKRILASLPNTIDSSSLPTLETIDSFRQGWANFAKPQIAGPLAEDVTIEDYVEVNSFHNNPLPIRIFRPRDLNQNTPVILCTAGGGFIANRLETNQTPWSHLAQLCNLPVVTYQYTTAPEATFTQNKPQGIIDAETIAEWLSTNAAALDFDPQNIFLVGDSSGGNFALYQAYALGKRATPPIGLIVISPVTDISRTFVDYGGDSHDFATFEADENIDCLLSTPLVEACYELYAPEAHNRNNAMISPLYIDDLADNLPPTTIIVASCDRMKRDSYALQKKLGTLATLFVLPGTHAFLTARALFDTDPGLDPIALAAATINTVTKHNLSQAANSLSDFQSCIETVYQPSTFSPRG